MKRPRPFRAHGFKARIIGEHMGVATVPQIEIYEMPLLYAEEVAAFRKWLSQAKKWIEADRRRWSREAEAEGGGDEQG